MEDQSLWKITNHFEEGWTWHNKIHLPSEVGIKRGIHSIYTYNHAAIPGYLSRQVFYIGNNHYGG